MVHVFLNEYGNKVDEDQMSSEEKFDAPEVDIESDIGRHVMLTDIDELPGTELDDVFNGAEIVTLEIGNRFVARVTESMIEQGWTVNDSTSHDPKTGKLIVEYESTFSGDQR